MWLTIGYLFTHSFNTDKNSLCLTWYEFFSILLYLLLISITRSSACMVATFCVRNILFCGFFKVMYRLTTGVDIFGSLMPMINNKSNNIINNKFNPLVTFMIIIYFCYYSRLWHWLLMCDKSCLCRFWHKEDYGAKFFPRLLKKSIFLVGYIQTTKKCSVVLHRQLYIFTFYIDLLDNRINKFVDNFQQILMVYRTIKFTYLSSTVV